MNNVPAPRGCLKSINPYSSPEKIEKLTDGLIDLSSNESASSPSENIKFKINDAIKKVNRYGDRDYALLRKKIGDHFGLKSESIVCGNGSSEIIYLIASIYLNPGDEVIVWRYGYQLFEIAAGYYGAKTVKPCSDRFLDIFSVSDLVTDKTKIIFLDNPNNPTGAYVSFEELLILRKRLSGNIILVIDSAYAEYVRDSEYDAGERLAKIFSNVVMLRTFSKIYGLAGVRLGWAYSSALITDELSRYRQPCSVNILAQAAGIAALDSGQWVGQASLENAVLRNFVCDAMNDLNCTAYPSGGNFILIRFQNTATAYDVYTRLLKHKILCRKTDQYGLNDCFRVTIGTRLETERFVYVFRKIFKSIRHT